MVLNNINERDESKEENKEYINLKGIIHHTWVEMKPEFLSLLSATLNK